MSVPSSPALRVLRFVLIRSSASSAYYYGPRCSLILPTHPFRRPGHPVRLEPSC